MTAEELARQFHETYERLAPSFGYETRKSSAVLWKDVPAKNKNLMIATCDELLVAIREAERAAAKRMKERCAAALKDFKTGGPDGETVSYWGEALAERLMALPEDV